MVAGKEEELYEFIILAQLMYGHAHGYLIAKIINDMIGPYARLSYGRLYPLMAKMEQNGLIAAESKAPGGQKGDRQMRVYTITDAGRIRFHHLMSDTTSSPGDYQKLFTGVKGEYLLSGTLTVKECLLPLERKTRPCDILALEAYPFSARGVLPGTGKKHVLSR